jgi:hypothetical protein
MNYSTVQGFSSALIVSLSTEKQISLFLFVLAIYLKFLHRDL